MDSNPRNGLLGFFKVHDLAILAASFGLVVYYLYFFTVQPDFIKFFSVRIKVQNFLIFSFILALWHFIFLTFDLYKLKLHFGLWGEAKSLIKATLTATAILGMVSFLFQIEIVTVLFLAVFWAVSCSLLILNRWVIRSLLNKIRMAKGDFYNLLIIGTNERARHFSEKNDRLKQYGFRIIGFVDEPWESSDDNTPTSSGSQIPEHKIVADFGGFNEYLRKNIVDEVVILMPVRKNYNKIAQIIAACEDHGIIVRMNPSVFNLKAGKVQLDHFEDDPLMTFRTGAMQGIGIWIKKFFDFSVSLALIILLSPLLIIISLVIRCTSPGPILFKQERIGLNKRHFLFFKFRTMVQNAEALMSKYEGQNELSGPVFKIKDDPRITRVGKILRKTSLDELPQLINVLKGDMSLVGPRPLPLRDFNGFDKDWHRRRFSVKPGITCLWQIQGRNSIPFDQWMELDMKYIDRWSLALDLLILIKTIPAVLRGTGAA